MEISSPSGLWKDYDVTAAPLNERALTEKNINGVRVREYYFDGHSASDGKVRAFIRISENPDTKRVLLYMPANSDDPDEIPEYFLKAGYTVAVLDYLGQSETSARFTLYPKSISNCNSRGVQQFNAPSDAFKSRWYIWTCIARRAVHFLRKLYPESNMFALGKGLGGSTVYKLATFNDGLIACATMLNILPTIRGSGNQLINYRAALDNTAYASLCKIPLFMAISSNDEDKSFDEMSELAGITSSLESFRIVERAFSKGIRVTYNQCEHFFTAKSTNAPLLPIPIIAPSNSNNKLYFNITLDDAENRAPYDEVRFYCAFRVENPMHRNWTNVELVSMGAGKYLAHVFVLDSDKPIYVFAAVSDNDGNIMSSELITVIPKTLGLKAQIPLSSRRRLIYESSMGKDLWAAPRGGNLFMKSGPFGIDGITSDCFSLATFKPSDFLYKVDEDSLLQIIINGKPQKLKLSVVDESGVFSCELDLTDPNDWTKFTLSPKNLMNERHLSSWKNVMVFILEGTDEFLVSSVIWV